MNTNNLIFKRDKCRLCDSKQLVIAIPLLPTPVAEKYLAKNELDKKELFCPLDLYMCKNCGHIQLLDIVEPNFLYNNYTYSSGRSPGLVRHFESYAKDIYENYSPSDGDLVVDIGSNDGTLLKFFKKYNLKVLGIDPASEIAAKATNEGIETIPEFFNEKLAKSILNKYGKSKIITANNAFAHMDNLNEIMIGIKILMNEKSIFVFEISYLFDVIDKVLLGTIFHEHHSYHSLKPLTLFFDKFDMELIDVSRNNIQGGSLIGVVQIKRGAYKIKESVRDTLSLEKKFKLDNLDTFKNFSKNLIKTKNNIKSLIKKIKNEKKTIAGFGAARSGTTLITQMEIGDYIEYMVDDNLDKQGKYSPGDHILVRPTSYIYENFPDYMIILAWVHAKNIIENNQKYLDKGGAFIVCFPELKIIKK